ncbi:MAG: DUF2330 domain-containing protein [Sandaracinaceae bacterium]
MCGCMVSRPPPSAPQEQSALLNKATVVVMLRDGTHTVLSFQNDYFGPAEDFALVVPVPVVLSEDDVTTLDRGLFDRLQAVAAPHMVELYEQNPCPQPRAQRGMLMDAMGGGSSGGRGAMAEGAGGAPAPPPVVVEAQFQEGEYDITILGANDSSALERWLADNGYRLPNGAERFLRPYVQAGMKFFVARVDIGRLRQVAQRRQAQLARARGWMQQGGLGQLVEGPPVDRASDPSLGRFLSPLRIHYESEEFSLPVRLGLLNSIGEQDLVVHILSPQGRYEVANYGNRWVPTNVHVNGRAAQSFGRFYDAYFAALSGRAPRRVWTEYAGPLTPVADSSMQQLFGAPGGSGCVGCGRPGLAQADLDALGEAVVHQGASRLAGYTLTRLHYRYGPRGLPNDLVFRPGRPMAGGIEDATLPRLSRSARSANRNEFRVRFIAQHRWTGPVACAHPQRNRWGGRPFGLGSYRDAEETPWPENRPVPLGAWIRDSVPQLGIARGR